MKYLLIVLFIFSAISAYADDLPREAIVRVYVKSGDTQSLGTGFFVNPNTIATAYHVIQGAEKIEVKNEKFDFVQVYISGYDEYWDIAILVPAEDKKSQFHLETSEIPSNLILRKGYCLGHPDGKINFQVEVKFPKNNPIPSFQFLGPDGIQLFEKFDNPAVQPYILPLDMTLNPGMSGGPILVTGKVIGVVSGSQASQGRTFGWAIPSSRVTKLFNKHDKLQVSDGSNLPKLKLLNSQLTSDDDPLLLPPLLKVGELQSNRERYETIKRIINLFNQGKSLINQYVENEHKLLVENYTELANLIYIEDTESVFADQDRLLEYIERLETFDMHSHLLAVKEANQVLYTIKDLVDLIKPHVDYINKIRFSKKLQLA